MGRVFSNCRFRAALLLLIPAAVTEWASGQIDYTKPELGRLKTHYVAEKEKQDSTHLADLRQLAQGKLTEYEESLAKQKRTGNITGMAVARGGIRIFQDCLEQLEKNKDFKLPERIRRELQRTTMDVARKKQQLDSDYELGLKVLRQTYHTRFLELCRAQGADTTNQGAMEAAFDDLMGGKIATGVGPAPGEAPAGAPGAGQEPGDLPQVQSSTNDISDWATFAYWGAEVNGMEVFRIPVFNRRQAEKDSGESMIGTPFRTEFQPVRILPPGRGYAFQLRKMGTRQGVEVLEWPDRRNKWNLVVRARPSKGVPSRHAVEMKVGFAGAGRLPLASGEAAPTETEPTPGEEPAADAAPVAIRIESLPENAEIYIDGVRLEKKGVAITTPCTAEMQSGVHAVALKRFGFREVSLPRYEVREGKRIAVQLVKDTRFKKRTFSVAARGIWQDSGITLDAGDMIQVEAAGTWDCGGRGEQIGPEGYANSTKYFHYYVDPIAYPRQTTKANYGALLMRIGKEGTIIPVPEFMRARIKNGGRLYFDVNEATGSARKDNAGSLTVLIHKGPGG